jgi:hypothetical protein
MKALSFGLFLGVSVALLACGRTAPSAPVSAPVSTAPSAAPREGSAPVQCLPATYASPCGASAWGLEQEGRKIVAFVMGPGSPSGLGLDVLRGDNSVTICGRWSVFPDDDLECGLTPQFIADHFSVSKPVKRQSCVLEECSDVAGPPSLTSADLDSPKLRLDCQPDGGACRILDPEDARLREDPTRPTFYIREKGVGPFLLGMPAKEALELPGFELKKSDVPPGGAGPLLAVRVAGEHVLDLILDRGGNRVAEIRVLTASYLTQVGIRPGMRASEVARYHGRPVRESSRGEQTCATFEHGEGLEFCFTGKAGWSKIAAEDGPIASILVVPH